MRTFNNSGGGATAHEPAMPFESRRRNDVGETPQASSDRPQGTLTRREIAHAVCSVCPGISRRQAKELIDAALEEIVSTLAFGEDVILRGFGKFAVRQKSARIGRNPKTGVGAPITARRVITFKASGNLKAVVDGE